MADRTRFPESFPRAVAAVDQVLAENANDKGEIWKTWGWLKHTIRAREHATRAQYTRGRAETYEHLSHAAVRALMALQRFLEQEES